MAQALSKFLIFAVLLFAAMMARGNDNWPQFRGANWDAHSDSTGLATEWSESKNVKWKTVLPGEGWSSPVIWAGQIWMSTALDQGHSLRVLCVDQTSGKIVHDIEVFHVEHPPPKHEFNSYASPTCVLEAGRVYACFGTCGSACLDSFTGKPIWVNHELTCDHLNGPGSSPIIFENLYLLCCDGVDVQYVAALDKNTGKLAWKTERTFDHHAMAPDLRKAYNTPLVVHYDGRDELISVGAHRFYCYDVHTGQELWYCDQPGFSCVSQPLFADGVAYLSSGFGKADLWAIRADGSGDVGKTHVMWKFKRGTPCRSTPLLLDIEGKRRIFMTTDNGITHLVDAITGEPIWQKRIGYGFSASPLYADGSIWCFDEKGTSTVIKASDELQIVAENHLDDGCMGTPAISGKALFIRTKTSLYCIERPITGRF
jgi:outer membrane protein assembly factor BamB